MYDFGKIVYLDVQKTGSTFVRRFLEHNLLAPLEKQEQHAPVTGDYRSESTYVISVRNPLEHYFSLFRFGLDGRGQVYFYLRKKKMGYLYNDASFAGFEKWLAFFLSPRAAKYTGDTYRNARPRLYGYQSYRFLTLSFQNPHKTLKKRYTRQSLQARYEAEKIHSHVLHTETLGADLLALADSSLAPLFRPPAEIGAYLADTGKINASQTDVAMSLANISPELLTRLKDREWFIYRNFYPDA